MEEPRTHVLFDKEGYQYSVQRGQRLKTIGKPDAKPLPLVKAIYQISATEVRVHLEEGKSGPWGNPFTVTVDPDDVA